MIFVLICAMYHHAVVRRYWGFDDYSGFSAWLTALEKARVYCLTRLQKGTRVRNGARCAVIRFIRRHGAAWHRRAAWNRKRKELAGE